MIRTAIERNIVFNTVTGPVTTSDIVDHIAVNIDNWIDKPVLWDISDADLSNITTQGWIDILRNGKSLAARRAGQKTALVSSKDLAFGMIRMLETMAEVLKIPLKFHSFRDIASAIEWLTQGTE
jgi:hypothetical protein